MVKGEKNEKTKKTVEVKKEIVEQVVKTNNSKKNSDKSIKQDKVEKSEKDIELENKNSELNNNSNKSKKIEVKKDNKRIEKLEKLVESMTESKVKNHILYVSHLPWGTDESFVKKYFEQFGTINRYYLPRSKNTGRIKGYCFIEFDSNEACKIAAQTMNNYILFEKILKCQVIEDSSRFNGNWRNHFKYVNKYKVFVEKRNAKKTVNELKERVNLYLKKEEEKRKKLEEMGIKYDFPGFKACLTSSKIA